MQPMLATTWMLANQVQFMIMTPWHADVFDNDLVWQDRQRYAAADVLMDADKELIPIFVPSGVE